MCELKIAVVNFSDVRGGAAIASSQQVKVLRNNKNIAIDFLVAEKKSDGRFSIGPTWLQSKWHFFLRLIALLCLKLQKSNNKVKHSLNIFSCNFIITSLQEHDYQVIHFNWINNETISITSLIRILKKNIKQRFIFTLHDDWFFCGSEHCVNGLSRRYLDGYNKKNKDVVGIDVDRIIFNIKLKLKPFLNSGNVCFTAPSSHLVNKAKSSLLLRNAAIKCIPNIIDTDVFKPCVNKGTRNTLDIDNRDFVILFGAIGGGSHLKGSDLLLSALEKLSSFSCLSNKVTFVTFGGKNRSRENLFGFDTVNLGHIDNKHYLASIYSSANVTIVPSRLESFGQVAAESLACQTPVIAFNNSGLTDIVVHEKSGYLVNAFDTKELANAIHRIINLSPNTRKEMGEWGRQFIVKNFSPEVVKEKWLNLYNQESFK